MNQAGDLHSAAVTGAATASADTGGQLGLLTQAVSGSGDVIRSVITGAQVAAQVGVIVILSVLIAFYFLADGGKLWAKALGRVRPDVAPEVDAAGSRAFNVLGGYMIGTGAISFVGAASQLVIMLVLGIPLALPVFVLSFFLCFIPYIGGFVSTGIALLVTIAVGSPLDVGVMIVWTLVFNIVTGNIVTPLVYGRMVHLHPAVVARGDPGWRRDCRHARHVHGGPGDGRRRLDMADGPVGHRDPPEAGHAGGRRRPARGSRGRARRACARAVTRAGLRRSVRIRRSPFRRMV